MRIAVGIPLSRKLDWRTETSHFGFINDGIRNDFQIDFLVTGSHERPMPITMARRDIAKRVLKSTFDWLFFFDSDATAAYGTLERLLSRDVPMISALCFKRKDLIAPAFEIEAFNPESFDPFYSKSVEVTSKWIGKYGQLNADTEVLLPSTPEGSLLEVDRCGTHCLLIHRSILEAVPEPRFERTTPPDSGATGSDYDFCRKVRKAGFPIYVDMSVVSGHLDGAHMIAGREFMMSTLYMNVQRHAFETERDKWHNQQTQEVQRMQD